MWQTARRYGEELYHEWDKDNVASLAAALAFYATFSLVPMVLLAIMIGRSWFGESTAQEQVLAELHLWAGEHAAELTRNALAGTTESSGTWASLVSIAAMFLGATQLFAELQAALNRVWEVKRRGARVIDSLIRRAYALVMLALMGILLLASFAASAAIALVNQFLGGFGHWELVNTVATFVLGTGLFSWVFMFFPAVRLTARDVAPGAALTTGLLMVSKYLLALYVARASLASTYGAAGTLIVFLLWVYVSSQIVLLGAEFTQVHCRIQGRAIELSEHAEARG